MKEKTRKKKKTVIFLCVIGVVAIALFSFFVVAPTVHISKKYDIPFASVRLEKISLPYVNFKGEVNGGEEVNLFSDLFFTFKYEEKDFTVDYYKLSYYDDFQLESISIWITEFLQNNVDEHICGVQIAGEGIAYNEGKHTLLKEYVDKKDIINYLFAEEKYNSITLFYYVNDLKSINPNEKMKIENELKSEFKIMIDRNKDFLCKRFKICLVDDKEIIKKRYDIYVSKEGKKYVLHNSYFGIDRYELLHYGERYIIELLIE